MKPESKNLLFHADGEGNFVLLSSWNSDAPEAKTMDALQSAFPCTNAPGCYCVLINGKEYVVWCPRK